MCGAESMREEGDSACTDGDARDAELCCMHDGGINKLFSDGRIDKPSILIWLAALGEIPKGAKKKREACTPPLSR